MARWIQTRKDESTSAFAPPVEIPRPAGLPTDTLRLSALTAVEAARNVPSAPPPADTPRRRPISSSVPAPMLLHARRGAFTTGSHDVEMVWRWPSLVIAALVLIGIGFGVRSLATPSDGARVLHRAARKSVVIAAHGYVSTAIQRAAPSSDAP